MRTAWRPWLHLLLRLHARLELLVLDHQASILNLDRQAVQWPGGRPSDDLPLGVEHAPVAGALELLLVAIPPEAAAEVRADRRVHRHVVCLPTQRPRQADPDQARRRHDQPRKKASPRTVRSLILVLFHQITSAFSSRSR